MVVAFCARFFGVMWLGTLAALSVNVPGLYDVPRSGEAGLARRLRLSASDVTKGNVPEGPEGAKRPERIARVSRSRIGVAPLSVLEIGAYIQRAT